MRIFKKILIAPLISLPILISSCSSYEKIWQEVVVSKVIDGDTFIDSSGFTYRLFGIDTPESFDKKNNFIETQGQQKYYANLSYVFLSNLINNKKVSINFISKDEYKRKVAKVKVNDTDVAIEIIKNGLARVSYISINKKDKYFTQDYDYYKTLLEHQLYSYQQKNGIWKNPKSFSEAFPND